ncbi:MAG: hypothetical protein Kow0077_18500 [Anaerolineae bacterium]
MLKLVLARYPFPPDTTFQPFHQLQGRFNPDICLNQQAFHLVPSIIIYLGSSERLRNPTEERLPRSLQTPAQ